MARQRVQPVEAGNAGTPTKTATSAAAQMQRPAAVSLKVAGLQVKGRPHTSSCRTAELAVELDAPDVGG